jgi:hypothetical protein
VERKFKVLRFIGSVYKTLGIVSAVLTLIAALALCLISLLGSGLLDQLRAQLGGAAGALGTLGGAAEGVIVASFVLIYGVVMTLMLYGAGEGIYLLLALEENTRATAITLQQFSNPDAAAEAEYV